MVSGLWLYSSLCSYSSRAPLSPTPQLHYSAFHIVPKTLLLLSGDRRWLVRLICIYAISPKPPPDNMSIHDVFTFTSSAFSSCFLDRVERDIFYTVAKKSWLGLRNPDRHRVPARVYWFSRRSSFFFVTFVTLLFDSAACELR